MPPTLPQLQLSAHSHFGRQYIQSEVRRTYVLAGAFSSYTLPS